MFKNISRISWIRKTTTTTTTTSKPQLAAASVSAVGNSSGNSIRCLTLATPATINFSPSHSHKLLLTPTSILVHSSMASSSKEAAASAAPTIKTNRLTKEKSPYLLQHAHNPVDWYPWGEEAIQRARTENKLIFLSVGYSTCHWCHVMEHESFENKKVASIMNANFVNIKVDREERPDIDKIYMQFLLMMNGSGGWPMSVWLTPDLAPITAGTYFPPHDRWGMPSFTTVLNTIAGKWNSNQEELKTTGLHVIASIQKSLSEKSTEAVYKPGSADAKLQEALRIYKQRYDQQHGGFGTQPKFPEISRLNFLFHAYIATKDADVLDMALQSLEHIGRGGIHDHVFGGFSRYAVDREWHVPHFEKMLYDQGQLMSAYSHAYKLTHNETFFRYADGIFRYIMKDLRHPDGGFYAGEDADSLPKASDTTKVEGAFYAWSWDEVKDAITQNAALYEDVETSVVFEAYAYHYGLQPKGNVEPASDPHGHLNEKNILIVRGSYEETSQKFGVTMESLHEIFKTTNQVLHDIREKRPRPHLDTKIICSWNGLVLSGLSKLANCGSSNREEYMRAAEQLFNFMRSNFYVQERKTLLRSCYGVGTNDSSLQSVAAEPIDGFLDDYAFLIKGLLDYYKASLDGSVLEWAKELQEIQDSIFWDKKHGAYFYSQANAPNVIVRLKEDHDGAEPCGNSVSARNLILFSHYLDDKKYSERARKLFEFFADVHPFGYTLAEMMSALLLHEHGLNLIAVVGSDSVITKQFVEVCRKFYIPGMIILHVDPDYEDATYNKRVQQKFKMINGKTTVYICHDKVCRLPVTDPAKLEENLTENFFKGPTC